jgi:uncharacterized protein (DUF2141 family)
MKAGHIVVLGMLAAAVAIGVVAAAGLMSARLEIDVHGVTPAGGTLVVGLYDEATFPATPIFTRSVPKVSGDVSVVFDRLPQGAYALKAFQDVNNDGRWEKGEPLGISNGAPETDFNAASVVLMPGVTKAQIALH